MKYAALGLAFASASVVLASCASTGFGGGGGGYDAWYDGYYGPFNNGYWGGDGIFRYRDNLGREFSDVGGHFRHGGSAGFNAVHGHR